MSTEPGHLINGRDRKRRISSEAKALFVGGYVGAKAPTPRDAFMR
jgi:hypothetical protein